MQWPMACPEDSASQHPSHPSSLAFYYPIFLMFPELCGDRSLSSVRQGLSTSARLAGLRAPGTQLSLVPSIAGVSGSYCNALPRFCMGAGVPNVGPHVYTALPSYLPSYWFFFIQFSFLISWSTILILSFSMLILLLYEAGAGAGALGLEHTCGNQRTTLGVNSLLLP